jgi:hypothetical protein
MTSLKEIRYLLRDWIEDDSIDDVFANFINEAIKECETIVDFSELYAESAVTVPDSGIFTEPARCRKIIEVFPATTTGFPAYRFVPRQRMTSQNESVLAEYTMNPYPGFEEEEASYTVSVEQGSKTIIKVGSTFFAAADVGKRVMIDSSSELYEITAVTSTTVTVTPAVTSDDSVSTTARLNPAGTRRFILRDPYNNVKTGAMIVSYQRKHPRVYEDASLLLIPCPRSVALIALQQSLMTNKYSVDAQRLAQAVVEAKHAELDNTAFKTTHRKVGDSSFAVRSRRGQ